MPRHPCPTSELLSAASPSQGEEPAKVDRLLGLSQASTLFLGGSGVRHQPPASPPTHLLHGPRVPGCRYADARDKQAPARGLAPSGPAPPLAPSPAAWVLATHWPGAGRSGGSATTGSSRASRGSRL